jgi:hypothetical protein
MYLGTGAAIPEHLTVARRLARDARLDRNRSLHCRACLPDFSPCCASLLRIKTWWSWTRAIATRMKSGCFQWTTGLCALADSGDE